MDRFLEKHNLVWHSTPASIEAGKTSLLAALETLIMVAIWWYAYFKGWFTWWTIGIGLISSVIVLLRCDDSVEDGLRRSKSFKMYSRYVISRMEEDDIFLNRIMFLFYSIFLSIKLFLVILFTRLTSSFKFFSKSFSDIPKNWIRTIWSTDIYHSPELMPKISNLYIGFSLYPTLIRFFKIPHNDNIFLKISMCFLVIIIYLPAFLYRFAIKSTAWLWFPLIYIQRGVLTITEKPFIEKKEMIDGYFSLWWQRLLRWYSSIFLIAVIISVTYPQWTNYSQYLPNAGFFGFIENYRPNLMQLLAFSTALLNLTIFLWFINPLHLHVKTEDDLTRHKVKFAKLVGLLRVNYVLAIVITLFGFVSFMFLKTDMPWHDMPDYFVTFINRLLVTPINLKFW